MWCSGSEHTGAATLSHTMRKREAKLGVVEGLDVHALGISGLDRLDLENVDTVGAGTMTSSHVTVGLGNCTSNGNITVLAVHVVVASARIVLEPDSVVLDRALILLEDLKQ